MKKTNKELYSLNSILPKLYIEDLEQRLETAPISIGSMIEVDEESECTGFTCTCNFLSEIRNCEEWVPYK